MVVQVSDAEDFRLVISKDCFVVDSPIMKSFGNFHEFVFGDLWVGGRIVEGYNN